MDGVCHIGFLADELLNLILSFLVAGTEAVGRRDGIYKNSWSSSQIGNGRVIARVGERSELDRYRLVCKRFMRIATPWKFRRFVLRFSRQGFQRLDELLNMQLASHTRYFTYMVRPSYQGHGWQRFLKELASDQPRLVKTHTLRLADQTALVERNSDLNSLKRALASFSSLRQIKLLRLQDRADEDILEQLRDRNTGEDLGLTWEPACSRAVRALGIALLGSSCRSIRFSGPQLSPEAALKILHTPSITISAVGERLTCLDITFHSTSTPDLTSFMTQLSGVFRKFFFAAKNLMMINIGFPANNPVDVSLEAIFHHLQWDSLRSLGIQGWRLTAAEIIDILRRHQSRLREIRMPYIYLREGSRWLEILSVLHHEMEELERVDLRDINYAKHFDAENLNGVEVPPGSPEREVEREDGTTSTIVERPSEIGVRPGRSLSAEELRMLTANDLGDNGVRVEHQQWLLWERWAVSRSRDSVRPHSY